MDANEALVDELRRYLNSAQRQSLPEESAATTQLKRDLNLAARVGQQLLMQLQAAEKSKETCELEIARLRAQNAQLQSENQKLALDQDLLAASMEEQDTEIAALAAQLSAARQRSEHMARAAASARALEREVEMLAELHAGLRKELETSAMQRDEAERRASQLTASISRHLRPAFAEVQRMAPVQITTPRKSPVNTSLDTPNATPNTTLDATLDTSLDISLDTPSKANLKISKPNGDTTALETSTPKRTIPERSAAKPAATPVLKRAPEIDSLPSLISETTVDDSESFGDWTRPRLQRSQSHESVFSVRPQQPAKALRPLKIDAASASQTLAAVSGEHYAENTPARFSARDKLSSMRAQPDRRRWFFLN